MQEEGIVSVWIGEAASAEDFEQATTVSFSEDGEFLGSKFSQSLNIGYFDSGLIEAEYREAPCGSLQELLHDVSYAAQILRQFGTEVFEKRPNCFLLLYNYRFGGPAAFMENGVTLHFLGLATYNAC